MERKLASPVSNARDKFDRTLDIEVTDLASDMKPQVQNEDKVEQPDRLVLFISSKIEKHLLHLRIL